jgi:myosin-crossreactive antigen
VCPPGSTNLALAGRFVNIPGETTVTFDYEVRSAQLAAEKVTQRLKLAASGIQQRRTGLAHEVNL